MDISDLVSNFNVRFQALGDNVARLETKLQTSMEEADDLREQLKASNEQKDLVEKELAELKGVIKKYSAQAPILCMGCTPLCWVLCERVLINPS